MQVPATLPLLHLKAMMGPHGLYQHASVRLPNLVHGYCTDDNARAVQLLSAARAVAEPQECAEIEPLLSQCWQFLQEARAESGLYFNFRTADGHWLPQGRSEDMYARLIRAYATILHDSENDSRHELANAWLKELLQRVEDYKFPRAWAEILIALNLLPAATAAAHNAPAISQRLLAALTARWQKNSSPDWPWFERTATYANALLPHALLSAHTLAPDKSTEQILHRSTEFLLTATIEDGIFLPIGSRGWYPAGGTPSRDNQQPIEAGTTFDFLLDYDRAFPGRLTPEVVAASYLWFFGQNSLKLPLVDQTGACLDGIFATGPNPNCGAESLLAYLWATHRVRAAERAVRDVLAKFPPA